MRFVATRVLSVFIFGLCTSPLPTANHAIAADSPPAVDFHFADLATAQTLLGQNDTYTATASAFDRKVRMGMGHDPGVTKYLEFVSAQAQPWKTNSRQTLEQAISATIEPLASLGIQLASPVNLIHTTGKEEAVLLTRAETKSSFPLGNSDPKTSHQPSCSPMSCFMSFRGNIPH